MRARYKQRRKLASVCCGWNPTIWVPPLLQLIDALPFSLKGKKVLEIGASPFSTLSPLFLAHGSNVTCSYYQHAFRPVIEENLERIKREFDLDISQIQLKQLDLFKDLHGTYDVITTKSVLGGLVRQAGPERAQEILRFLMKNLNSGGALLQLDNGLTPLKKCYRKIQKNPYDWCFFDRDAMKEQHKNCHGYFLCGHGWLTQDNLSTRLGLLGKGLDRIIGSVDKLITTLFHPQERAVWGSLFMPHNTPPPVANQ